MISLYPQGRCRITGDHANTPAANPPAETMAEHEELDLTSFLLGPNRFVLRVLGDSMIDAGILDGDMVVVERCERATNGDIVVALIDSGEACLRRLQRNDDGTLTLHPANAAMPPLRYSARRVTLLGRVVGQMRRYR